MNTEKTKAENAPPKNESIWQKAIRYVKTLGPGLITGASDDDPSGIGTYAQTGAQFGYTQLWITLFTFPLMVVVQEMCARIALQTGSGLARVIRRHYPRWIVITCISLLLITNTITMGADLGAMAASGQLILPLPFGVWLVGITLLIVALQVWVPYNRFARILRIFTLSLFAYLAVIFIVHQDWGAVLHNTLVPTIQIRKEFLINLMAMLGTTISPYLFFWQASQEVEEKVENGKVTPQQRRGTTKAELRWMRTDVITGMLFSNLVAWAIIITTASTLFAKGITNINTPAQAAEALKPVAGPFATGLFALGIIGTGLLAIPVLAGSAGYAVADTFKLPQGLSLKPLEAPGFYTVIAVSTMVGAAINVSGINPITALYYASVASGLISPPLLYLLMRICNNPQIMKKAVNGRLSNVLGWTITAVMTVAALALLASLIAG